MDFRTEVNIINEQVFVQWKSKHLFVPISKKWIFNRTNRLYNPTHTLNSPSEILS